MADPIQLPPDQFLAAARQTKIVLCEDVIQAEKLDGQVRAVYSGLVPEKNGIGAWVWPNGLCLVSADVYRKLGGEPNV